jgi:hypothetical protein
MASEERFEYLQPKDNLVQAFVRAADSYQQRAVHRTGFDGSTGALKIHVDAKGGLIRSRRKSFDATVTFYPMDDARTVVILFIEEASFPVVFVGRTEFIDGFIGEVARHLELAAPPGDSSRDRIFPRKIS